MLSVDNNNNVHMRVCAMTDWTGSSKVHCQFVPCVCDMVEKAGDRAMEAGGSAAAVPKHGHVLKG